MAVGAVHARRTTTPQSLSILRLLLLLNDCDAVAVAATPFATAVHCKMKPNC